MYFHHFISGAFDLIVSSNVSTIIFQIKLLLNSVVLQSEAERGIFHISGWYCLSFPEILALLTCVRCNVIPFLTCSEMKWVLSYFILLNMKWFVKKHLQYCSICINCELSVKLYCDRDSENCE